MRNVIVKLRTSVAFADQLRAAARQAAEVPNAAAAAGVTPELALWMLEVARAIEQTANNPPSVVMDPAMPLFLRRQAD